MLCLSSLGGGRLDYRLVAVVLAVMVPLAAACKRSSMSETLAAEGAKAKYLAAIDMGSSGAKMLVQQQQPDGTMLTVKDLRLSTKLGEGVSGTAAIPQPNQERTLEAIQSMLNTASREFGIHPGAVALIATAVTRNASNGKEFIARIRTELGVTRARILSGEEEARYGFLGAIAEFRTKGGATDRYATLDLGGGSFQLAVGTRDAFSKGGSTQIGSNQIVARWLPEGVLTVAQFAVADAALVAAAPLPMAAESVRGSRLIGTGSISKFLAAHLATPTITVDAIKDLRATLGALEPKARVAVLRGNKSAEVQAALGLASDADAYDYAIKSPASATLLLHIMEALAVTEMTVSETDVRYVLIAELVDDAR